MKIANLPTPDQEPKPNSADNPKADGQTKRKTKLIVHSGMLAHHPLKIGQASESTADDQPISSPVTVSDSNAKPAANPDGKEIPSDSMLLNMSTPSHAPRSSDLGGPLHISDKAPGQRLHDIEQAAKQGSPAKLPWYYRLRPTGERTHRAYWDVAATLSLIVNILLVATLVIMAGQINNLRATVNNLLGGTLGGLYSNFIKMDQASINTTITVNTQIPLNFTLPVSQPTNVVLTNDVNIPRAHVTINTGILNINAQADVTLPAGTSLPIMLNLNIPVQSTIPVSLQVPVNIPLNQTGLHEPFAGLQASIRPLTCLLNQDAQYPDGIFICGAHETPTPGTP